MKVKFKIYILMMLVFGGLNAQEQNPKKAQKQYQKYSALAAEEIKQGEFAQAEALYRKALDKNPEGDEAAYNFGNLYFENQKKKQSTLRYLESAKSSESKMVKHRNYHNLGNLMMEAERYDKAVEAYKNALRNNPNDEQTRYNLALAKAKAKKDEGKKEGDEEKGDKKKKEEDKGGEGDKDKKEQDQQNSKEGENDKENKQKQKDANKDPKEGDSEKQKQPSKPTPQKGEMTEQQVKNLLQAIENKEKDTQEKLNAKKVKGARVKTEKDW